MPDTDQDQKPPEVANDPTQTRSPVAAPPSGVWSCTEQGSLDGVRKKIEAATTIQGHWKTALLEAVAATCGPTFNSVEVHAHANRGESGDITLTLQIVPFNQLL